MQIPPFPFHALPTLPLIHHHGFSQGKETKYNHCRLPRGRGTVAAETGLSRWLSALGSQTLGLPQHMEDTNTGTCHAFEWLERTSRELMCRLKYLYCSFTLQLMVPTTLRTKTRPNFPVVRKFSAFLCDLPSWCFGKKSFFSIFDNSCKEVYSCVDINLRFKSHLHSQDRKPDKTSFLWCKCCPRNLHFSWEWWPCKWECSSSPRDSSGIHLSNQKKRSQTILTAD